MGRPGFAAGYALRAGRIQCFDPMLGQKGAQVCILVHHKGDRSAVMRTQGPDKDGNIGGVVTGRIAQNQILMARCDSRGCPPHLRQRSR